MCLASTSDHIDIGKMNQESRIQVERANKRQSKGSSCVLKVKAANTRTVMLVIILYVCINASVLIDD